MKKRVSRHATRPSRNEKDQRLVALTVKVDSQTYVKLSTVRAQQRKTAQEILVEALKAYLAQS